MKIDERDAADLADLLRRNGSHDSDDDVREISRALLVECERGKEALTDRDRVEVSVMHPRTGRVFDLERVPPHQLTPEGLGPAAEHSGQPSTRSFDR